MSLSLSLCFDTRLRDANGDVIVYQSVAPCFHLEHIYLIVYYAAEIAENISVFSSRALSVRPALTRSIYHQDKIGDTKPRLHTVRMDSSSLSPVRLA